MKIVLFILPVLGGGGAEKVVLTLLNNLDRKKYTLYLLVFKDNGDYMSQLLSDVNVKIINNKSVIYNIFNSIIYIRNLKPDFIFSTMRTISAILLLVKPVFSRKTKLILRENNTPSVSIKESRFTYVWKLVYKYLFKRSELIICQSDFMKNDFVENFNFNPNKLLKIYNPVDIKAIKEKLKDSESPFNSEDVNIVFIGKMSKQKGIDDLLISFSKQKKGKNNYKLWIIGTGKLLNEYRKLSSNLQIADQVTFIGKQDNPYKWMRYADLFILPSRYEGLPNVVLEAVVCGCPIITTAHPGGTKEIMNFIGQPNRVVTSLNWNESWFEKQNVNMVSFYETFNVTEVIKKYEEVLE